MCVMGSVHGNITHDCVIWNKYLGHMTLAWPQVPRMLVTWAVHRPIVVDYLFFMYDSLLP